MEKIYQHDERILVTSSRVYAHGVEIPICGSSAVVSELRPFKFDAIFGICLGVPLVIVPDYFDWLLGVVNYIAPARGVGIIMIVSGIVMLRVSKYAVRIFDKSGRELLRPLEKGDKAYPLVSYNRIKADFLVTVIARAQKENCQENRTAETAPQ